MVLAQCGKASDLHRRLPAPCQINGSCDGLFRHARAQARRSGPLFAAGRHQRRFLAHRLPGSRTQLRSRRARRCSITTSSRSRAAGRLHRRYHRRLRQPRPTGPPTAKPTPATAAQRHTGRIRISAGDVGSAAAAATAVIVKKFSHCRLWLIRTSQETPQRVRSSLLTPEQTNSPRAAVPPPPTTRCAAGG